MPNEPAEEDRQSRQEDRHQGHASCPTRPSWTRPKFNFDTLAQRLRELAFLNKGLKITLTDERDRCQDRRSQAAEFNYNGGIAEFIKHLNRGKRCCTTSRSTSKASADGVDMEIALQYNDGYSETVFSFANNINTVDGGTHLSGFRTRAHAHHQLRRASRWACSRM